MKCPRTLVLLLVFLQPYAALSQTSQNSASNAEKPKSQTPQNEKADPKKQADKDAQVLQVTWDQFLDDYEPSIRSGSLAALMPMSLRNKYGDTQVIWSGVFKGLFSSQDKKPFVVIGMKPRSIRHRDGDTTVDFLMPNTDPSEVDKWNALRPGDSIRFRIKLSGFVRAVPSNLMRSDVQELRDKSTPVVILFMVDDARIVR